MTSEKNNRGAIPHAGDSRLRNKLIQRAKIWNGAISTTCIGGIRGKSPRAKRLCGWRKLTTRI